MDEDNLHYVSRLEAASHNITSQDSHITSNHYISSLTAVMSIAPF